nr:hypothetical protein [Micromonospora sp. DSM 115978]
MPFVDDVVVGSRWRRVLPAVLGLLVVLFLGAGAYAVGQVSLAAAEQSRLDQRARLVEDLNSYTSELYDPVQLRATVDRLPFSPTDAERDRMLLEQVSTTSFGEPNESVALVRPDGTTLASLPGSVEIPVADLGASWQEALDGQPTVTDVFELDGEATRAVLVPVGGSQPWGVIVTVPS